MARNVEYDFGSPIAAFDVSVSKYLLTKIEEDQYARLLADISEIVREELKAAAA